MDAGSNPESVSFALIMGRKQHLSLDTKQAIWNLYSFFNDEAQRGRSRYKSINRKIQSALKPSHYV